MKIKTNILNDSFGRHHNYLRISLIEKCNLRCAYCMPEEGVLLSPKKSLMTAEEVLSIAKVFVKHGVDKIRLTGGEPLLRKDFSTILEGLSQLNVALSITTNAVLVDRHIEDFKKYRLHHINVSLDTLIEEKFTTITKRNQFQKVKDNLQLLLGQGFKTKINVVLMKGFNDTEVIDFIKLTKDENLEVRFIEFMPFDGNKWSKDKLVSHQEILDQVNRYFGEEANQVLVNEQNFTARNYKIRGFKGRYGIISTVTNPFCDGCNRIRLTANGKLKNCLFSNNETDLLSYLRKGESIEPLIAKSIYAKKAIRAGMTDTEDFENPEKHNDNRSMITIGG
ncbi:GTP 3',8-cyclase MoaA [Aquimarina sp. U1-2]|uniref:GTP 3',8-cyclase MoaA n=1 Tax=Aquimarina sp. U1-2 TaxID=2823141 RepID=UPI001AECAD92|nr:GTP 3',8-cyclase MoaA [Aquimarina sp. U1-2]MBP2833795.1 GTP 3',8-cyclase MoaA [Aquimarina sp. U1-2]